MDTILVAASNASSASKARADYVCNGATDSQTMENAAAAIPSDGGVLALSEGVFALTAPLNYPNKCLRIVGVDRQATQIACSFTSENDCVVFYPANVSQSFEHAAIVGDGENTRYGIEIGIGSLKYIGFVNVKGVTNSGVHSSSGNSQNYLERVITTDLVRGFSMYGCANNYVSCQAMRSSSAGLGGDWGFRSQESGSSYSGCVAEKYEAGFQVSSYAEGVTMRACYAEACGVSLAISGSPGPVATRVYAFSSFSAQHARYGAIRVYDSDGTFLRDPFVRDSTSGLSIEIGTDAKALLVSGGSLTDASPYSMRSGTVARFRNVSNSGQWLDRDIY